MSKQQEKLADPNTKCEQEMPSKGPLGWTPPGDTENTDLSPVGAVEQYLSGPYKLCRNKDIGYNLKEMLQLRCSS